jgi:hypothetical protein
MTNPPNIIENDNYDENKDAENISYKKLYLEISNIIFDIKEKMSDNEYKKVMEILYNNNYKKIEENNYIFKFTELIKNKIIKEEYNLLLNTIKKIKL